MAQFGNTNAAKPKKWAEAINKALLQFEDPERHLVAGQALTRLANKLIEKALDGDAAAITEIGNRLDGKAAQAITVGSEPDSPIQHNHTVEFIGSRADPTKA